MKSLMAAEKNSAIQEKRPSSESTPVKLKNDEKGKTHFICENGLSREAAIKQVTGTKDYALGIGTIFAGAAALASLGLVNGSLADNLTEGSNMVLRSLNDFKPKDAVEARLSTQATVAFEHAMNMLRRGASAETLHLIEAFANLGIKFMRVHNETIEALNRYRRGGEQKVTVTHIAEKMAVIHNYGGGGEDIENKGDNSCQECAEPSLKETNTSHADNQQWPTEDAGSMAGFVQVQKQKKAFSK